MPRPTLASLLEDFRNWNKTQDWMLNKQRDIYGNEDPDTIALNEKLAGIGTADMGMMGSSVGGLAAMLRASHGSPHLFNRFDFSKIGTGEGAQAYGHGGYFAQGFDSPIAKQYQKDLSNFYEPFLGNRAGSELSDMDLEVLKALEIGKRNAGQFPHNTVYYAKKYAEGKPELLSALNEMPRDVKFGERLNQGNLYNVELKWPDAAREAADPLGEHHLLDWDAPLSEQPENVRKALSGLNLPAGTYGENPVGAHAYAEMAKRLDQGDQELLQSVKQHPNLFAESPELVSAWLKSKGIPGIRYLDQGSRGAGTGSRNYVVFDDRIPNIVSRNGVSLTDLLRR